MLLNSINVTRKCRFPAILFSLFSWHSHLEVFFFFYEPWNSSKRIRAFYPWKVEKLLFLGDRLIVNWWWFTVKKLISSWLSDNTFFKFNILLIRKGSSDVQLIIVCSHIVSWRCAWCQMWNDIFSFVTVRMDTQNHFYKKCESD